MLKILTQVLKSDGTTVDNDAVVVCTPQPYQPNQALVSFSFFHSLELKDSGYHPFVAIKTADGKEPILDAIITLEDGAYSNAIIDTASKDFLEEIYGEGNIVIL
jgi:hypothetical protein